MIDRSVHTHESANTLPAPPAMRRFDHGQLEDNGIFDSPSQRSIYVSQVTPTSPALRREFSSGMSNASFSLLDTEGREEDIDVSLASGSDHYQSLSRVRAPANPNDDASFYAVEPVPLSERRGIGFTVSLQQLHDSIRSSDTRTLEWMLNKIARLLALQMELTSTLSHELRTNISNLKFSLANLNKGNLEEKSEVRS